MQRPALWDHPQTLASDIKKIETHGSVVLLGKHHALKLKKQVTFDHMDYGSPSKRSACLHKEYQINSKTAQGLYLAVEYAQVQPDGQLNIGNHLTDGEPYLKMKRFADTHRLDHFAAINGISDILGEQLADGIIEFHKAATVITNAAIIPAFTSVISRNFDQLNQYCPVLFDQTDIDLFRRQLAQQLDQIEALLQDRFHQNWIRYGHGDMHLQNICILDGKPVLFDAIEYEDDFIIGDVLYDLSFLLMDLAAKGFQDTANQIFNQYVRKMGWLLNSRNLRVLRCLPFFMAMRAGIRTHVAASQFTQATTETDKNLFADQARNYLKTSFQYLHKPHPIAIAIGGYSGSGKSTIAKKIASMIGSNPGALRIRSDEIRRQLIDWDDFSPMPQHAYTSDMSQAVYTKMQEIALAALAEGHSVILDAVLDREIDRLMFQKSLSDTGTDFYGFWLVVDPAEMEARISGRTRDASDATVGILRLQLERHPLIQTDWTKINANGPVPETLKLVLKNIN